MIMIIIIIIIEHGIWGYTSRFNKPISWQPMTTGDINRLMQTLRHVSTAEPLASDLYPSLHHTKVSFKSKPQQSRAELQVVEA